MPQSRRQIFRPGTFLKYMTTKFAQILVVAPHPDDAEFGAAGTNDPKMTSAKLAKIREKEQLAAAKIMGVRIERIKQRCKTQAEGTGCELAEAFYRFELSY